MVKSQNTIEGQRPAPKKPKRIRHVTTTQLVKYTPRRYKCPVHHGKNLSVSVGFIDGRAWAKCWSQGCASADILAALGITNTASVPWTPPPAPRRRPTFNVDYLPPVSPFAASEYLRGIQTSSGATIAYQRNDGQRGHHWRNDTKRRNPGVIGDGWQLRRFDPADPLTATAICLAEGEKDAAILAIADLIAFAAPRGAQSLPLAAFTELADLVKATGLPVFLAGDNDEVGRKAMRDVRLRLKTDFHIDAISTHHDAPGRGSIADLETMELQGLIRNNLADRDPRWQKPSRARKQHLEYKCYRPKRNVKGAGDLAQIWGMVPCDNTATCSACADWANYLHIERCYRGQPEQMMGISGFGGVGSSIPETVGLAKVYRKKLEDRLRQNSAVDRKDVEPPSSERRNFMTALALRDDYRASLSMFFTVSLSDDRIEKERRRAHEAGLEFRVKNGVTREDIEDAAPPALSIKMEGVGMTDKTNTWTSSGWNAWWEAETTYPFSEGRNLEEGEDFPTDSISAKEWRSEHNQKWDSRKSLKENLWQREEYAHYNSQLWMANCHGLGLETLKALMTTPAKDLPAVFEEIGDYLGPRALLIDAALFLCGLKAWRKAFKPVLDAAGWDGEPFII